MPQPRRVLRLNRLKELKGARPGARSQTFETVERLVPIRLSDGNEPLFFMPIGDGSLHYVRNLARDLNPHSPDNVLSFGVTCAIQI
jgi:hypothetical protein